MANMDIEFEQEKKTKLMAGVGLAHPLALLLAAFFYMICKLPQLAQVFWFTENQGEAIVAFFAFGSLLAASNLSFIVLAFQDLYRWT